MNPRLLILLYLVFAGCSYPTFTHPIVVPEKAERFEEILGVYTARNPDTEERVWLHVGKCADNLPTGFHKFVLVSPATPTKGDQGMTVYQYIGFVFREENSYVVQIPQFGKHMAQPSRCNFKRLGEVRG